MITLPLRPRYYEELATEGVQGFWLPLRPRYYEELATEGVQGFWFCRAAPADLDTTSSAVEQRCPRFFPPREGTPSLLQSFAVRHYVSSNVRLYVECDWRVLYKYWRALNPTPIATVEAVRSGRFHLDCTKLHGRYLLLWQRD